jgi:hypothetical protein
MSHFFSPILIARPKKSTFTWIHHAAVEDSMHLLFYSLKNFWALDASKTSLGTNLTHAVKGLSLTKLKIYRHQNDPLTV